MHQFWTSYRPVLHRYLVLVKYRSLPLQYRSFSPVLEREFSGLFRSVPLLVLFRSVCFGPVPYCSPYRSVPFRAAPSYRKTKTADT